MVTFEVDLDPVDQDTIRRVIAFIEEHVLVVHGRTVLRVGAAELHLAGEGTDLDGNPGRIHRRAVMLGDRLFHVDGDAEGWWVR